MDHLLSRSLVGRTTSEYLTPEFLLSRNSGTDLSQDELGGLLKTTQHPFLSLFRGQQNHFRFHISDFRFIVKAVAAGDFLVVLSLGYNSPYERSKDPTQND